MMMMMIIIIIQLKCLTVAVNTSRGEHYTEKNIIIRGRKVKLSLFLIH
jgi:hypothetical protein